MTALFLSLMLLLTAPISKRMITCIVPSVHQPVDLPDLIANSDSGSFRIHAHLLVC